MVFRGKRSTACELCRERRIKCDRKRPSCTQCLNSNAKCKGYRSELDLLFLNETDHVARRATSRYSRPPTSKQAPNKKTQYVDASIIWTPAPQINDSVEFTTSQALSLFVSAYAGGTYLEYLPNLYKAPGHSGALEASLKAVALSYMSNDRQRSDLRNFAQQFYGSALALTATALQTPDTAATPETMASVLLLALFATISMNSLQEAQDVWSKHIHGICAILASNPSSLVFRDPSGQGLLHHIISVIQMDCLQRREPHPPQIQKLYCASRLRSGYQVEFWLVIDRLAMLNAQFGQNQFDSSYLMNLQELDADIQALIEAMPQKYPQAFQYYETRQVGEIIHDVDGFRIPQYVFSSYRNSQPWNTLRMMRLVTLNLLVSGTTSYLARNLTVENELLDSLHYSMRLASQSITEMAIQICGTVPNDLRAHNWIDNPDARFRWSGWARSLIWPLGMAKDSHCCPPTLQAYIERQLQTLGFITGMRAIYQENALLDNKEQQRSWTHITYMS